MTAVSRMLVLVSASLLMAATAVADNGITVDGAISGSSEPIEAGSLGQCPPASVRLHTARSVFSCAARDRRMVQFPWNAGIEFLEDDGTRPAGWGPIACEFGAGLFGAAALGAGGVLGGAILGRLLSEDEGPQDIGFLPFVGVCIGWIVGAPLGASLGTFLVGEALQQNGEWGPTYRGAFAGTCLGVPLYFVGSVSGAAIGATIGYNTSSDYYGERHKPGAAELCSIKDRDGGIHPSLDVRLLSVKF